MTNEEMRTALIGTTVQVMGHESIFVRVEDSDEGICVELYKFDNSGIVRMIDTDCGEQIDLRLYINFSDAENYFQKCLDKA